MIFENILKEKSEFVLGDLVERFSNATGVDPSWAKSLSNETLKEINAGRKMPDEVESLLTRWYDSLQSGNPDYSVYGESAYIAELWVCWKIYSRAHLLNIQKPTSLIDDSISNRHRKDKLIVDLGCGFAYTTASISQIFPEANVIGTNIEDTVQMSVAQSMATDYGFKMANDPNEINESVDLIFASEYFEHFERPIDHLDYVIECLNPKALLIANAFGPIAIGHFKKYQIKLNDLFDYQDIDAKSTSKIFNDRLKYHGYNKIKTKLWNNRPAYWVK